jgi:hypothetical protein
MLLLLTHYQVLFDERYSELIMDVD